MNEIVNWSRKVWSGDLKYSVKIDRERQTLSPSDLGFHNTFKLDNGKLMFYDFEYFGWDDPVKLVADFSHHAAMNFTDEMEKYWFNGVSNIYGKKILSRLRCLWPLYGLNWCLIILNEFKSDVWNRRCAADSSKIKNREYQLITQLRKAEQKLHYVYEIYKDKEYW
jgi:thiamine kinase-like enzyme